MDIRWSKHFRPFSHFDRVPPLLLPLRAATVFELENFCFVSVTFKLEFSVYVVIYVDVDV